jgi:hypothetical protein
LSTLKAQDLKKALIDKAVITEQDLTDAKEEDSAVTKEI